MLAKQVAEAKRKRRFEAALQNAFEFFYKNSRCRNLGGSSTLAGCSAAVIALQRLLVSGYLAAVAVGSVEASSV